ncbi:MAG: division/cell wall cluster transcriptional repressor MraZ [Pseudomonadota bacterium]|nr:division/cell wall cluster transcriptional repressor MraZ [Pseudomonadota bacterium]
MSTFTNKVDRKGRVSIPAAFRAELVGESYYGIVIYRMPGAPALEACGIANMARVRDGIARKFDPLSENREDLDFSLLGETDRLPIDSDGRIVLPADLLEHAGLAEHAAFVGLGDTFQIWSPTLLVERKRKARERMLQNGVNLRLVSPPDLPSG